MSNNNGGFVQLRRGILDHCERGDLSPLQFAGYTMLILLADSSTGIAWSSAKSLEARYGYAERYARKILEALESKDYIKRFPVPGRHGSYPILVNKYLISRGARKDLMLNAVASTDWKNPIYEIGEEECEGKGEGRATIQEGKGKRDKSNTLSPSAPDSEIEPSGKPSNPGDLAAMQRVWDYFIEKLGKNPKLLTFTQARKRQGIARLMEAKRKVGGDLAKAEQLMIVAVDTLASSPWHGGDNPGSKKYQKWEKHLFGSAEQFEGWLEAAQ